LGGDGFSLKLEAPEDEIMRFQPIVLLKASKPAFASNENSRNFVNISHGCSSQTHNDPSRFLGGTF
jgi:hypothetical protein